MAELEPMMTMTMTRELPADILFSKILPRVPARSVTRFKCVSKQWHSFLRTPGFLQMHQVHVNKNSNDDQNNHNQKLMFLFITTTRPWEYRSIDCDSPQDGFTASRPFPFDVEDGETVAIITSLNGLVCVGITKPRMTLSYYSHLILWNPATGDHKTLSKPSSSGYLRPYKVIFDRYELYYISSEDDYKLLWLTRLLNVYIYSLKSDSWRKVEEPNTNTNSVTVSYHHNLIMSSVMLNDKYDFLRKSFDQFEGPGEQLLSDDQIRRTDFMGFMVLRGRRIHFCVANRNSIEGGDEYDKIELWWMSPEVAEDWDRVRNENLSKYDADHPILELVLKKGHKLLHIIRNGNWLMYSPREQYIYQLDMQLTKHFMCYNNFAFDRGGLNVYMETLVSPNQYNI